jgi:hypothetical protein
MNKVRSRGDVTVSNSTASPAGVSMPPLGLTRAEVPAAPHPAGSDCRASAKADAPLISSEWRCNQSLALPVTIRPMAPP